MIKEIIDNINSAEREAEQLETAAVQRAREIYIEAQNKADEMREQNERKIKSEIKSIMAQAEIEGEKRAAAKIKEGRGTASQRKNTEKAVQYIIKEYTARL